MKLDNIFKELGISIKNYSGKDLPAESPIDGERLACLKTDSAQSLERKIKQSVIAFKEWRDVPAPKRGELVRLLGEELRKYKEPLARLVSLECGKILEEGRGEVQEMIDICDFAIGLSRTIGGLTIPSERPNHSMQENWLPLGPVGIISAFNFPVAVWSWNAALALICGDSVIWKPSEKTPLCAVAIQEVFLRAAKKYGNAPENLSQIVIADRVIGEILVNDKRLPLISATGSTSMGRKVGEIVANRFGKSLLELGGNNAIIVTKSADLNIALPSILFGAAGTAGQRCTTTRRLIVHKSIEKELNAKLKNAYKLIQKKIGNPLENGVLVGPLIDEASYNNMQKALKEAKKSGAEILGGNRVMKDKFPKAYYVEPALALLKKPAEIVNHETFAPILYVMTYDKLEDAIEMNNSVPQGLSSAIFTTDIREAEIFKKYSDCGISNVNIGTSGAEIGGAFGGEKETGGGRESGADAWKNYMRRQTSTTYYGQKPPALAQGIKFTA